MRSPGVGRECGNCRRPFAEDELDEAGWCHPCRREVVRRATRVAHGVAAVLAGAFAAWVMFGWVPAPRFLAAWLALIAGIYFFVFYLVRRVGFAVIRGRGVPPQAD